MVALEITVLGESFDVSEDEADIHFTPSQRRTYAELLEADGRPLPGPQPRIPGAVRAAWASTRLTFVKRHIDKLGPMEQFAVMVEGGPVYVMSRAQFESTFSNVVASRAYDEYGNYNYKETPVKAAQYAINDRQTNQNDVDDAN